MSDGRRANNRVPEVQLRQPLSRWVDSTLVAGGPCQLRAGSEPASPGRSSAASLLVEYWGWTCLHPFGGRLSGKAYGMQEHSLV